MRISGLLIIGIIALWLWKPDTNVNIVRVVFVGVAVTLFALGSMRRERR